jgi:hypothetical protein
MQFEGGFQYLKTEHELTQLYEEALDASLEIRYGFFLEQLELTVEATYSFSNYTNNRFGPSSDVKQSGLKQGFAGAKYLLFDPWKKEKKPNIFSWNANNKFQWSDLLPAVAVIAGANFVVADNPPYGFNNAFDISPRVTLATQNNFLGRMVLVTNISYGNIGSEDPELSYIVTLTHSFNGIWSLYVENQGIKSDSYADALFRGGIAYLLNKDTQLEVSYGGNFKNTPYQVFGNIGLSYRIDNHQDKEIIKEIEN